MKDQENFRDGAKKYFEKRHPFVIPHDEIFGFTEKEHEEDVNRGERIEKIDYFDPEDFE